MIDKNYNNIFEQLCRRDCIVVKQFTQYFSNIEHSALATLRENLNMKDNKVPTIAPFIANPVDAVALNIDHVTIDQLFDAQLPYGASVSRDLF